VTLIAFALIGLGLGAVYAALGLGVAITYKAPGVINFAAGALGAWAAYVYSKLRSNGTLVLPIAGIHLASNLGTWTCLAVAVAVTTVLGVVIYLLVFRPLRQAPMLAKVVASAGVMIGIQPLIAIRFGVHEPVAASILPSGSVSIGHTAVPVDSLWLAGIAIVATALIWVWFRLSRAGIAMRAAAENEFFLALARSNSARLAALAWALSSFVIAAISVLAAPLIGVDPSNYTLLIVPALAAVLVGRMKSLGWIVAGGLALGMINGVITDLSGKTWWPSWAGSGAGYAIPFIAIVLLLIALGRSLPARDVLKASHLPAVPRGRVKPVPLLTLAAVAVVVLALTSGSYRFGVITSMIYAVMALSFVVLTGLLGQVSFAQGVLAGTAGFALSKLSIGAHLGFPWGLILASLVATALGVVAGIPALRIRGIQLTVVTLAAAVTIEQAVFSNNSLVGSVDFVPAPQLFGLNLEVDSGYNTARIQFGLLTLVILVGCALAVSNLIRSATGRRFLAVRSNERAAAAVGIDVAQAKLIGFAISSFLAGVSGCLIGYSEGTVSVASFTTLVSVSLLMFAYLGGITSVGGALVAGTFAPLGLMFTIANGLVGATSNGYELFAAIAVIVTTILNPEGIAGKAGHDLRTLRNRLFQRQADDSRQLGQPTEGAELSEHRGAPAQAEMSQPASRIAASALGEPVLVVENLSVRFGGVVAVDHVSLMVPAGAVVGLIGANGAGKTTLIDALSGFVSYDGTVRLNGSSLDRLPPHRRAGRGLARTWQSIELFGDLTVRDNVLLASERASLRGTLADFVRPGRDLRRVEVDSVLDNLGIAETADLSTDELALGQRKRVNIARALALRPRLVILDEAVSALDKSVEAQVLNMLVDLKTELSLTYLFISHDLNVVQYLSDRVLVMYLGKIVELGPVEAIYGDPQHPYTRALLSARPSMDPRKRTHEAPIQGDPPSPIDPPSGCRFRTRCPFAEDVCARVEPLLAETGRQEVACHMRVAGSGHSKAAA
jgi:oligopeptide/dipeptide ABC transporter ATP-binding protein